MPETPGPAVTLRHAYDLEVRTVPPTARAGLAVEIDGPVWRTLSARGGRISYPHLNGLTGTELDALIRRQRDHFAALGRPFDWITHPHDDPADLPDRLLAAGGTPTGSGTILAGRSEDLAAPARQPEGVVIREVDAEQDFQRIADMQGTVWGLEAGWLVPQLAGQHAADPDRWTFLVAEADDEVVSAGWIEYLPNRFAMLYGGATLPAWQGRGIYRALVSRRAREARARGLEYVAVDASEESRPILERLGLAPVATRVTYHWKPEAPVRVPAGS